MKKENIPLLRAAMKVAIFLGNENFDMLDNNVIQAYTLNVEDRLITSIGNEILTTRDVNYITLWLLSKQIKVLYAKDVDEKAKDLLAKIDVEIKPIDEIKNHPILKSILL